MLVLPVWRPPLLYASWCPSLRLLPQCHDPWPFLFLVLRWFLAPVSHCPRCPVPVGACLLPLASPCPLAAGLPYALSLPGVLVEGRGGGLWGADGPCPGQGCLKPPPEGFRGVGGADSLDSVPEEGCPCRLRHGGIRGGLVGAGGDAGADLLEGLDHVHPLTPSCSPGRLHPAAELPQGGYRPPGETGGGKGGGGLRAQGPGPAAARGRGSAVLLVGGAGRGHGTAVARVVTAWGAGAAVARAAGEGRVWAARVTGGALLFVAVGRRRHGTAVARLVTSGRGGAALARAGAERRVSVARGTGSAMPFVGGRQRRHGTAVARVVARGGEGAAAARAGGGGRV